MTFGATRPPLLGLAVLAATIAWLGSRVVLGLDLTDEMQYYGELAGLARHGRFFQDDLFIQQLGYAPLVPLFALHARVFPDQAYLLLFGRLLLLAAYCAVGLQLWRTARALGSSRGARLAALATFAAWIPFQIFAFGYNSLSYLLIVLLIGLWLRRSASESWHRELPLALAVVMLGLVYPPAGIALAVLAVAAIALRDSRRAALRWFVSASGCALLIVASLLLWQGPRLLADFLVALQFSRAFGVGEVILLPTHLGGWALLMLSCGMLVWRLRRAPAPSPATERWLARLAGAAVLVLAIISPRTAVGYFATAVFVLLLVLLRLTRDGAHLRRAIEVAIAGLVLGTAFAFTSGNGFHNFGVGAVGVMPWLVLPIADALEASASRFFAAVLPVAAAALLLANGVFHPYREQAVWHPFAPIADVPAFRGLRTSPTKAEAIATLRRFSVATRLDHTRLLVAGPHAWIYFVARAEPVTPMFFLHFSGKPAVYDVVAARLFAHGTPDAILLTTAAPPVLHSEITGWARNGVTAQALALPADFVQRYQRETGYDFASEVVLLRRAPQPP